MSNFINGNYIYISGLWIKYGEQFRYFLVISPGACIARKAACIKNQYAISDSVRLALNSLNIPTIIDDKIIFVAITERKRYQVTSPYKRGHYFSFSKVSLFSSLHEPHPLPYVIPHREAQVKVAMMRYKTINSRRKSLAVTL
jgi:hypothetical protein